VAAKERKRLRQEKVMKHMECQKRGASLLDYDDDDNEEGFEEEFEELAVL
jgi:hypothetical protein